jgi:uncharacterized phage infection (PIP) family protein YhgE
MPSAFEQNLTKIVTETKGYKAEYTKLPSALKVKDGNYRNVISMIYEAQKAITELKEQIKKGKQGAVDEMKKWHASYPKIFARLKPCVDEIAKLKKSLDELKAGVAKAYKTAEQLNKDAARSAMGDVKTAAAQLKTVLADLKALADGIEKQLRLISELPKAPAGVFV